MNSIISVNRSDTMYSKPSSSPILNLNFNPYVSDQESFMISRQVLTRQANLPTAFPYHPYFHRGYPKQCIDENFYFPRQVLSLSPFSKFNPKFWACRLAGFICSKKMQPGPSLYVWHSKLLKSPPNSSKSLNCTRTTEQGTNPSQNGVRQNKTGQNRIGPGGTAGPAWARAGPTLNLTGQNF